MRRAKSTIELGSVAGALRERRSVGLIYIDLDSDLDPPDASDGALDWTGVAPLLDVEGAAPELSGMGPRRPMLSDRDVLYLGVDPVTQTDVEKSTMASRNLGCIELEAVRRSPDTTIRRAPTIRRSRCVRNEPGYSTRTSLSENGLANGPFWLRC